MISSPIILLFILVASAVAECPSEQYLHKERCCSKCEAGYKVSIYCTAANDTKCVKCPVGFYNPAPSDLTWCLQLSHCDHANEYIYKISNGTTDNECRCIDGYHYSGTGELCLLNPICPPGEGILDDKCISCLDGTYSANLSRTEPCAEQPNCEAKGLEVLTAGNSKMATVCYDPTEAQSGSGHSIENRTSEFEDGNEDLEVENFMSGGSVSVIVIICLAIGVIFLVVILLMIFILRWKKNWQGDPEAAVPDRNEETDECRLSLTSGSSIRSMDNAGQAYRESTETLPSGILLDEVTENSLGGIGELDYCTSVGMIERHRNMIRRQKPNLVENLDTKKMLDFMTEVFTQEDESVIMNISLSEYDQRRKFLDILCRKGPNAYPRFVEVLKHVTPELATLFKESNFSDASNTAS